MFSGGVGSFAAAERVMREHGRGLTLLFSDTLIEDADLYRFLIESAAWLTGRAGMGEVSGLALLAAQTPPSSNVEARKAHLTMVREQARSVLPGLVWLAEGRTPFEVFRDRRFLGNSHIGICSYHLKQQVSDRWLTANCDPSSTVCYVGIDWTEEHRYTRLRDLRAADGWAYRAPLCEPPEYGKEGAFARLKELGIRAPRLYALGFSHNNCGGGCVKAGIGHFANLYAKLPHVYAEWEANEQGMRDLLGKPVSMLQDRSGGEATPLTLVQLRRRIDDGHQPDLFDIGGCGCFVDVGSALASTPATLVATDRGHA